ncbi:MAG TPA: LuxR C-terminal-related transcriptional regulator [Actinomycetota bacterium]|nr:LuxR C-terminal-related transcriptional regulator [Actinomycetota bacterium]
MGAQPSASPRPAGPILLRTKLAPPPVRAGLIPRARLDGLLETGAKGRLCLVDAPAGSGKTTLLGQWWRADHGGRRVAWLSLDDGDDDPVRFWSYVVEAFRVVEPGLGEGPLTLLQGPGAADVLTQVILPELLNELATSESDLVLVLDDYHLVTNAVCHASLGFFVDHLPANVHLMVATRVDPPLALARLRASGELVELRIAELGFTSAEADRLLGEAMGLELTADQTQRLWERTEGWAAGLYLAGLSLRGRPDPGPFIASFEAGHRHVVDYLGAEVLARQPEPLRSFMVRTSVLQRLSGPLCDAVLETEGSAELLAELEQANLFLIALDDHRDWYRYHHLFAQLVYLELTGRDPDLVPLLHRRAAAWHQANGDVEAAVHHATAAGDYQRATDLVTRHWLAFARRGRVATVGRWLDGLPDVVVAAAPSVAVAKVWIGGYRGVPKQELERWLAAADAGDPGAPVPDWAASVSFEAAIARAQFTYDDVGAVLEGARGAVELAGPGPSEASWMATAALGRNLYLAGRPAEARAVLGSVSLDQLPTERQPFVAVNILGVVSLLAGEQGDHATAAALARQAMGVVKAGGVSFNPLNGIASIALAGALARQGELAEAEELLEQVLPLLDIESFQIQYAEALLALAEVRQGRGDGDGAQAAAEEARRLVAGFADPGMLTARLERAGRAAPPAGGRRTAPGPAGELTERELVVLRLLATTLSQREIAQELYVSVNTVRTHVQGVYRKLGVASREEAVAAARDHGLLPGGAGPG